MMFGAIGKPHVVEGYEEDIVAVYLGEFVIPVLRHTADLLTILEWADRAVGDEEPYGEDGTGRAPAGMSVAMVSVPGDKYGLDDNSATNAGSEGEAAQLAYKGWLVLIAGLWERYRKATPLHKEGGPRYGVQTALYGDWHKIRNDVLKHNGVAQKNNSGRCEILKWFEDGETIWFELDHVLEFLHHMGHQLQSYILVDDTRHVSRYVGWRMAPHTRFLHSRLPKARKPPWRVVSAIPMVEEDKDGQGSFTLGISLMFADAVTGAFYIERSADRDGLVSRKQAIERAPRDDLGCPIVHGIPFDVRLLHGEAKQALANGQRPMDTSSPAMQFGRPD